MNGLDQQAPRCVSMGAAVNVPPDGQPGAPVTASAQMLQRDHYAAHVLLLPESMGRLADDRENRTLSINTCRQAGSRFQTFWQGKFYRFATAARWRTGDRIAATGRALVR